MEQDKRRFQPTEDWPLQDVYKQKLHEDIQRWGECIAPKLEERLDELQQERIDFFRFIMESVPRDDKMTATLIQTLRAQMLESTRSWYTDRLGSLSKEQEQEMSYRDFERLFSIYHAGRMSRAAI
jgi:hypothetical protein